ncbi:MAG: ABC transporter permease [Bacteroidales bacterium]|nr:ABC transporter permease [Bacteroidales bacterium]
MVLRLIKESVAFAFSQLQGDKFRTFLSLFGVSIGIFSIVAIFTAIDALQENVRRGFDTVGSDIVQVSRWPMMGEDEEGNADITQEFKWWEYMRRPNTSYEDYRFLSANSTLGENISFSIFSNQTARYGRRSVANASVGCITRNFNSIMKFEVAKGRYFTPDEDSKGTAVAVIGHEMAASLFEDEEPVGKRLKVGTTTATVIGVIEKQGESMVSMGDLDYNIFVPLNFGRYMVNPRWADNSIYARPKAGVAQQELVDELRMLMRAHRRLAPGQKNNFSISTMGFIMESVQQVFSMINAVGWVIAGFSLLIGGFGIANIMFVSVKERTNIIGIQKALGAKKYVIMLQFLVEAAALAVAGGIIGILLVLLGVLLIPETESFTLTLSAANILYGVMIASVIGLLAGLIPAWSAASLNPVDAINSK